MRKIKGLETDHIFIVLLTIVFLWSGKLLFSNQYVSLHDENEKKEQLGVLEIKKNIVKYRSSEVNFWQDSQNQIPLYENDSIYTHDNSSADLKFKQGLSLSLGANTLFKVEKVGDTQNLSVKSGVAIFNIDKKVKDISLNVNGQKLKIKGQSASLKLNQNAQNSSLSLVQGEASIELGNKKLNIKKNERLSVNKNQEVAIEQIPIELISPKPKKEFYTLKKPTIEFKWKPLKVLSNIKIQFSKNIEFKKIVKEINLKNELHSAKITLPFGSYYWRIVGKEEKGLAESNTHILDVIKEQPPYFISPSNQDTVSLKTTPSTEKPQNVQIKWQDQGAKQYQLKIYQGNTLVSDNTISSNKFKFAATSEGQYSAKVKAIASNRPESYFSKLTSFNIKKLKDIEAPDFINHFNQGKLLVSNTNNIEAEINLIENEMIKEYQLMISKNKDFSDETFSFISNSSKVKIVLPKIGKWYMKSLGSDIFDRELTNTKFLSLSVELSPVILTSPQNEENIILEEPGEHLALEWDQAKQEQGLEKTYKVEISRSPSFDEIVETIETNKPAHKWKTDKLGSYYWRVKVDGVEQKVNQANKFKLVKPAPPEKPKLPDYINTKIIKKPVEAKNLKKKDIESTFIFKNIISKAYAQSFINIVPINWQETKNASSYHLQIYSDKRGENLVHEAEVNQNFYEWKFSTPGNYWLQIAIVDKWGQKSEFSDLSLLKVEGSFNQASDLDPIQLLSPYHKKSIDLETIPNDTEIEFKWSEVQVVKEYRFAISKTKDFAIEEIVKTSNENSLKIKIQDLKGFNTFYWRVSAITIDQRETISLKRIINLIHPDIEQTPLADSKEPKPSLPEKKPRNSWWVTYQTNPGAVDYSMSEGVLEVEATGNILVGHNQISAGINIGERWDILLDYSRTSATFFETIDFEKSTISAQAGFHLNNRFLIRLGAKSVSVDFFEKSSATTIDTAGKTLTGLNINLIGKHPLFNNWSFIHDLMLGTGGANEFAVRLLMEYEWSSDLILGLGVGTASLKAESENSELEMSKNHLILTLGKNF